MTKTFIDTIKIGNFKCGFCITNSHNTCPGVIRNGDLSLVQCACDCAKTKTPRCTECHTTDQDNLGRPWLCDDRDACVARIKTRLRNSPLNQRIEEVQARAKAEPRPTTSNRPSKGLCHCCGEATKGGKFLPGHDSTWLKRIAERVNSGQADRTKQLELVTQVSPALAAKLVKRLA